MQRSVRLGIAVTSLLAAQACRPTATPAPPRAEVEAALATYDTLIQRMDAAGIANAFTPDGESADADQPPLHGPEAIRDHLLQFTGFQVIANRLQADSTRVQGDTAWQTGTYQQRVRVPAGDTVDVSGRFEVTWQKAGARGWLVRRMHTFRPPTP